MGDSPVEKAANLHETASDYLGASRFPDARQPGNAFADLLNKVEKAVENGAEPDFSPTERLALMRVRDAYDRIASDTPFLESALTFARSLIGLDSPEQEDGLEERRLELAQRAVANVAKYVSAPEDENSRGGRITHGVLGPESNPLRATAAEIGTLHIETLDDAVHIVDKRYGSQFAIRFGPDGHASIAPWPSGEPMDLGERADLALTGGVTLHVVGGERPELLFAGEKGGVRITEANHHIATTSAEFIDQWSAIREQSGDESGRSFHFDEKSLQIVETTRAPGDAHSSSLLSWDITTPGPGFTRFSR